jgi:N-acetylglucosamine-6-phosphate deacetylase
MSMLTIGNGLLPSEFTQEIDAAPAADLDGFSAARVQIEGDRIEAVAAEKAPVAGPFLDATGCVILPGFVDVHVHGGGGRDTMDADVDGLAVMSAFFAEHGVTDYMPTTMTSPHSAILAAVRAVAQAYDSNLGGARILGVHLEGPYISPKYPGAQPPDAIREPNLAEFNELTGSGPVRMITLAGEQPGAIELIEAACAQDVTVVVGHTNATYDQCMAAFQAGASQATHTYNAMTGLHHRRPGTLGAVLSTDDVYAELIADTIHVHPAAMNVLARCKGPEHTVLITDAIRATGMPEGEYDLGGQTVYMRDGQCRLADGTLAGSVLTMETALKNFITASGWSLARAWPTTSRTPAESVGMGHELGSIRPGYLADLVLLDRNLNVVATVVGGEVVYLRDEERLLN